MEEYLKFATSLVYEAGKEAMDFLNKPTTIIEKENNGGWVTHIDMYVESKIIEAIKERYPCHNILSEETRNTTKVLKNGEPLWVIDPIDGTTNLVKQKINFTISIALCINNKTVMGIVYDPSRDELFSAILGKGAFLNSKKLTTCMKSISTHTLIAMNWNKSHSPFNKPVKAKGFRFYDCASLEMSYVACGRLDAYVSTPLHPWDYMAAKLICEEAECIVRNLNGNKITFCENSDIIAANYTFYNQIYSNTKKESESNV
ncbi:MULTISPECIES: inositol monophosphatase family protein [Bacillus cereus group]|uniref:Inositol-1-monophosphatase n=1 Tax=Bacillus thuringiensis TaxID=1428 RepID=A0A1C4E3S2_BACTU|nr:MULTISPECIES: inositol monophosphatase family protein [Bacillus cereus group]MED3025667.1 inositol monophosphatase family protein [Bacillus wiedmannii]OUB59133.1 hypothetical protein BK743_13165 [Bacillus thuringiensis serovar sylvestriensis]SCC38171.1 Inositol-1-monophosphatase [Bacillus thuringiensis]